MILTTLVAFLLATPAWAGPSDPLPIEAIQDSPVIEGCTCEFQRPNARVKGVTDLVFVSAVDWRQATIRSGDNVALTKSSAAEGAPSRKGERARVRFIGPDGLKVELDLTVNDVCPPTQPCDTVGLEGTMTAVRGDRRATAEIMGSCGC